MGINILAALAAGSGGYLTGMRQNDEEARVKKDNEWRDTQRAWITADRKKADDLDADLKTASSPAEALPTPLPQVDDEGTPNAAALQAPSVSVGQQQYMSKPAADDAVAAQNDPSAVAARMADVYRKHGDISKWSEIHSLAKKLNDEGATDFINTASTLRPNVAAIDAAGGQISMPISDEQRKKFHGQGDWKIPEGAQMQHFNNQYDDGSKFGDTRIVDKDGKVIVGSLVKAEATIGMSTAQRREEQIKRDELAGKRKTDERHMSILEATGKETARHNEAEERNQAAQNARLAGAAGAANGLARERFDWEKSLNKPDDFSREAGDAAKEFVKANPGKSAAEVQQFRIDYQNGLQRNRDSKIVLNTAISDFRNAGNDPQKFAQVRAAANKRGLTDDVLRAAGVEIPKEEKPQQAAPTIGGSKLSGVPQRIAVSMTSKSEPAPPGSPSAQWQERQAAGRTASMSAQAQQAQVAAASQQQFDTDVQSLQPLELLQKYPDATSRNALSLEQLAALKKIESQVR